MSVQSYNYVASSSKLGGRACEALVVAFFNKRITAPDWEEFVRVIEAGFAETMTRISRSQTLCVPLFLCLLLPNGHKSDVLPL